MKRIYLCAVVAMLFCGCTQRQQIEEDNTIYVSILPLRYIVKQIVDNDFKIEVLVPSGASPETFEPTPKQFIALNKAKLVFNVGLIDFESNIISKIADNKKVINLSDGIATIAGSCSHNHNGKLHAHGIDPHTWTSPRELQNMATKAYKAINELYPDSIEYTGNYNRLISNLKQLDTNIEKQIAESGIKYFIIYHPALTYYARDYNVQQVAIEDEGKEPTAKRLSAIIKQAREDGVKRILYQSQFPASTVEIIAKDINAECTEIDPLREDIITNIQEITDIITAK